MDFIPCDICGEAPMRPVRPMGRTRIMRCRRCGLAFLDPRPTGEELAEFYEGDYYASGDPLAHGYEDYAALEPSLHAMARQKARHVRPRVTGGGKLLDVGAGFGHFVKAARDAGLDARGVEIASQGVAFARERLGVDVVQGPVEDVAIAAGSLDCITMWDVLEHTFNARATLACAARLLRPEGFIFLTVPDADGLAARLMGRRWFGFQKLEHTYYFTPRTIRALLVGAGFSDVSCHMGRWSCSMEYIARRLAHYNRVVADWALAFCNVFGIASRNVDFRLIDMMVSARKSRCKC